MAKTKKKGLLRNSRGQFLVEAVLLMTLSVSLSIWAIKYIQEKKWMSTLISKPWETASGMIETGVWDTPKAASSKHPNKLDRHRTPFPK